MSNLWFADQMGAAARVPVFTRPEPAPSTFTPWADRAANDRFGGFTRPAESAAPDAEQVQADAFAAGFDEGRRTVMLELAVERQALAALAGSIEALTPEPPRALAMLLAETVERLVRQVVGEVVIDEALLLTRAEGAAAVIAEAGTLARMRLHPEDHARLDGADLPVALVADERIVAGTVLLETADGWIEDGPEYALEKLRGALDRMGVAR